MVGWYKLTYQQIKERFYSEGDKEMKRKGINLKQGQVWGIGKGTIKKVAEINDGLIVGDKVAIITFHGEGLIGVQCVSTGEKFDITSRSLTDISNDCIDDNMEIWINFYSKLDGRFLGGYTKRGTFRGELESTLELKAYDNNIEVSDIEVKYEYR